MRGEISLPVTDMNGMWLVRHQHVTIGDSGFTGNNLRTSTFVPNPVDGYKPVGVVGYEATNINENGVVPKDSSGKSYSGNTWLGMVQCFYDPETNQGRIQCRNYANTGSSETVNNKGGGAVTTFVCVHILYMKDNGVFVPSVTDSVETSSDVMLNYGLTATRIATYGRVCEVLVGGQLNQNIPSESVIATFPKPIMSVYSLNVLEGKTPFYISVHDGTFRNYGALTQGTYVTCSFTYITA